MTGRSLRSPKYTNRMIKQIVAIIGPYLQSQTVQKYSKLISKQLKTFLDENNIIVNNQSDFRSQHSTETTLLQSTNTWLKFMNQGLANRIILDPKKAFNTVDHQILLSKLEFYGVHGTALGWFGSYLYQRKQICKLYNCESEFQTIHCGAPQGSTLGPLLFLIYVNDLPNCLQTTQASLFADNTNVSCEGHTNADIEYKLNMDFK